ncbi:MAG: tetratricopeptide repeat protein [Desulfovibrionales bacterium]|nr:tetratricopeptide repeat protein [Desulfovibrionales bacterium]
MNRCVLLLFAILLTLLSGCMQPESESDLVKARRAFINKEYTEAERFYQRYIRNNETGKERWNAWNNLVEITRNVWGNKKRAVELLDAMLLEYSGEPERYREILLTKGRLYSESGLWQEAITSWTQLLGAPGVTVEQEAVAYAYLGKAHLMRGDYGMAVDAYRDCRELAYDDSEHQQMCIYALAQAYAYLGNFIEAEENLQLLLQRENLDTILLSRAKLLLADIYEQQDAPVKAISMLLDIQDTYPNPKVIEFRLQNLRRR